jgi:hypothetical protein
VSKDSAMTLVQQYPPGFIEGKIEQFDWAMSQPKPPKKPAGFLVKSILQNYDADPAFVSKEEKQRQAEARQARERQEAEDRRRQMEQDARHKAKVEEANDYWAERTPEEQAAQDAEMLAAASEEQRQTYETMKGYGRGDGYLTLLRIDYIHGILHKQTEPA